MTESDITKDEHKKLINFDKQGTHVSDNNQQRFRITISCVVLIFTFSSLMGGWYKIKGIARMVQSFVATYSCEEDCHFKTIKQR